MGRNSKYLLLFLLATIYLISRFYRLEELYTFSFDQYRDAWVVKQIIVDKKLTLIGPQSSFYGIFYGPFWYYSLVPFYWFFGLSPIGGAVGAIFYGLITLVLLYFFAEKIFSQKVVLFSSLIYIFSYQINFYNRACRNDPPLMLFSLMILFLLTILVQEKKKKKRFFLQAFSLGILSGVGLHYHFSAIVFLPMTIIALLILKISKSFQKIIYLITGFIFSLSPLIIFDLRHQFSISKSYVSLFTAVSEPPLINFWKNFCNNFLLIINNFWRIISPEQTQVFIKIILLAFFSLFIIAFFFSLDWKKNRYYYYLFFLWVFFPIVLFSFYPQAVYDYYFVLTFTVLILILGLSINSVFNSGSLNILVIIFFVLFISANISHLKKVNNLRSLVYLNQAIDFIKKDSEGEPIFIDFFSKDNFKVNFDYLIYNYRLNKVDKNENSIYSSYIFYVPPVREEAYRIYKKFGDIGVGIERK
ncbi:MAG: glycosyltransferase family 39 protein [Patescibacteria group bacterium]